MIFFSLDTVVAGRNLIVYIILEYWEFDIRETLKL